jgi:DNA-directed RNA polymerase specialized sigma24 family protein
LNFGEPNNQVNPGGVLAMRHVKMSRDGIPEQHSKAAMQQRVLARLSADEREALYRFYTLGQREGEISENLGFDESELRSLKARVKREFQAARWPQ